MEFTGFPVAALDFYDDLEVDNSKSFWEAHRAVYEEAVKAPMTALCEALEPEFGTAKIFRPYRDVRFAKDKTPYKTHQGAFVPAGPSMGWYVELSPRGVRVGGGFYEASGERLAAIRDAIADDRTGPQLKRVLTKLEKNGFEIGGEQLKTAPRGYDKEHAGSTCCAASRSSPASPTASAGDPLPRPARADPRRLAGSQPAGDLARRGARLTRRARSRHHGHGALNHTSLVTAPASCCSVIGGSAVSTPSRLVDPFETITETIHRSGV